MFGRPWWEWLIFGYFWVAVVASGLGATADDLRHRQGLWWLLPVELVGAAAVLVWWRVASRHAAIEINDRGLHLLPRPLPLWRWRNILGVRRIDPLTVEVRYRLQAHTLTFERPGDADAFVAMTATEAPSLVLVDPVPPR